MSRQLGQRLSVLAEAFCDAEGTATAVLSSGLPYRWELQRLTVQSNSALDTTAQYYRGYPDPINLLDETVIGNGDSSSRVYPMGVGAQVVVVWRQGTPGARCVARAEGVFTQ